MRRECIEAVTKALGRELGAGEAREIEQRISKAGRKLARENPADWLAMSRTEKLTRAGEAAAKEIVGEAQRKAELAALQIAANARIGQHLADMKGRGIKGLDALDRLVAFDSDGRTNEISIDDQNKAVNADLMRQLIPVMEASNPKWFGLLENRAGVEAVIKEMMGEDSGNPVAKAGAKIWKEVAETARKRFNRSGGDIGQLEDWALPHHHSQVRVARAGQDEWLATLSPAERAKAKLFDTPPPKDFARDHWVSKILPKLNRDKYVNEDGTRMTDAQLTDFLREAWLTIATGGANKVNPGQFKGNGARANRGSAERQIHFKDAQSFIDYQKDFGEKSLYEVLAGHIQGIAKDIALVENFGPNPDHTARFFRDQAAQEEINADPARAGKVRRHAIRSENLYNYVAGKTLPVASERMAKSFDTLRNFLSSNRLGTAAISSISDEGTLAMTSRINDLSYIRVLANELAAFNPANRSEERMAMRAGLALNTFISSLNRFGQDKLGSSFSKKLANTTLRASGLQAMTEARRRAFGVTAMGGIGGVVKDHAKFSDIEADDHRILKNKGVTDEDYNVWKAAQLEDWGNGNDTMLTPDAIYRTSDAEIDKAIGPRIEKIKDEAKSQLDELAARDATDRGWVQAKADKLSAWLTKAQGRLDERIKKADAQGQARLQDLKTKLSRLEETVDGARAAWDTPSTRGNNGPKEMLDAFGEDMPAEQPANTPGIDGKQEVRFYGKGKLRSLGMDEGRARQAIRALERDAQAVKNALGDTKAAELEKLFSDFHERRDELDEFTKGSQERISRRGQVADRIQRDLLPSIADARTEAREKAVTRLLGIVLSETDMAVIEPGAKEKASMAAGMQRGTWKGELAKSFWLFKSFSYSMIARHWMRAMSQPTNGGKAKYLAALIASTTVLGAMSMQIKELLAGRDPRNLNPFQQNGLKNWMKAMLQGGSLGLYGDFLFSESTQHGQSPIASFLGPVAGLAEDAFKLTQGNLIQAMQGKDTDIGAEATRFVRNNVPGANLWYSKAFLDHMIWNQLAEYFSPGYLSKVRRRAQNEFGQEYYWDPQDALPSRGPDLSAIEGQ